MSKNSKDRTEKDEKLFYTSLDALADTQQRVLKTILQKNHIGFEEYTHTHTHRHRHRHTDTHTHTHTHTQTHTPGMNQISRKENLK